VLTIDIICPASVLVSIADVQNSFTDTLSRKSPLLSLCGRVVCSAVWDAVD